MRNGAQTAHDFHSPPELLSKPVDQGPPLMTVSPEQLETGKQRLEWRKQLLGTSQIGLTGGGDLHCQEMALGIDEGVSFAFPDAFARIEAFFRAAYRTGCDRLTVNHCCTWLFVSALLLPHPLAQALQSLIPDPCVAPHPKGGVDRPPVWQIMGQLSPRAATTQDVENPIDDFASLMFDMGCVWRDCRDQGFQDLPLCVCQVRWIRFPMAHLFFSILVLVSRFSPFLYRLVHPILTFKLTRS